MKLKRRKSKKFLQKYIFVMLSYCMVVFLLEFKRPMLKCLSYFLKTTKLETYFFEKTFSIHFAAC